MCQKLIDNLMHYSLKRAYLYCSHIISLFSSWVSEAKPGVLAVCLCFASSHQTMPFPVVTDNLKVQMAIQTPSTWSKLFSFSKSHATILKLEGQVRITVNNLQGQSLCAPHSPVTHKLH